MHGAAMQQPLLQMRPRRTRMRVGAAAAAIVALSCALAYASLAPGGGAVEMASEKRWVPSLGFYVAAPRSPARKQAPHGSSTARARPSLASGTATRTAAATAATLDEALERTDRKPAEEAAHLHALLANASPHYVRRFMKMFKQEGRRTGVEAEATAQYLSSMLHRDNKRRQVLSQAKQVEYKYKGHEKWSKTPNFNVKGYWPLVGDPGDKKLFKLMRPDLQFANTLNMDKNWHKKANFNVKGYWPLDANTHKLAQHVTVDRWPAGKEKPMPEQAHSGNVFSLKYWQHFFDTGSKLKTAGISNKWWDTHNLKHNGVV